MGGLLPDDLFPIYFYYCGFCLTWLYHLVLTKCAKYEMDYEFLIDSSLLWFLFLPLLIIAVLHDNLTDKEDD